MLRLCAIALTIAFAVTVCASDSVAQSKSVNLLNGNNLDGWKLKKSNRKGYWTVGAVSLNEKNSREFTVKDAQKGKGVLINAKGRGVDLYSVKKFGDCTIELDVMVPKGSNSGIYVMGEYEVQILDSYGRKKVGTGDIGALYGAAPPKVNASKKPGEWQHFVIEFRAPKFKGEKKVANAKFVRITLNGKVIQENVEMRGPTPSCLTGKERPTGPIMFQGDHGPVAYRNIMVTPR